MTKPCLNEVHRRLHLDADGMPEGIERKQEIGPEFLKQLDSDRSKRSWHGQETLRIASIPLALVESLHQQGINLVDLDAASLVKMLKDLGYERFLAYGGKL